MGHSKRLHHFARTVSTFSEIGRIQLRQNHREKTAYNTRRRSQIIHKKYKEKVAYTLKEKAPIFIEKRPYIFIEKGFI